MEGRLARRVERDMGPARSRRRPDVDHQASAALQQEGQEGAGDGKGADQVRRQRLVPVRDRRRGERLHVSDPGVVDDDVDAAARAPRALAQLRHGFLPRHVGLDDVHRGARFAGQLAQGVGRAGRGDDAHPPGGEAKAQRPADARGGAGDDDRSSGERITHPRLPPAACGQNPCDG